MSSQHANFITTSASATSRDVLAVMNEIQQRISETTGIDLQREVVVWSRDPEACR